MEYLIGFALALAVAALAKAVGFDRDRAFYATVLIVVASYYILFAVMGAPWRTLAIETTVASGFLVVAVVGYKKSPWLLATALVAHGVFDSVHHIFIGNPGVPLWWPGFCMAFDVMFGGLLAVQLLRRSRG